MLQTICEIIVSVCAVYGAYCAIITISYTLLCRNKKGIVIAVFPQKGELLAPQLSLAKKAFLGSCRTIILIDKKAPRIEEEIIISKHPKAELYRIERIQKNDRSVQPK